MIIAVPLPVYRKVVCRVLGSVSQFLRLLYKSPAALVALQIMDATGGLILKLIMLTLFVSYTFASTTNRYVHCDRALTSCL
jgi:hypothetical protein